MKLSRLRLLSSLPVALSLGAVGCTSVEPTVARGVADNKPAPAKQEAAKSPAENLPPPELTKNVPHSAAKRVVPITLDAVLHAAEDQNFQVAQAREKLQEAYSDKYLADKGWIPDVNVGLGYNRHEGAIQNFRGQFLNSSFGSVYAPGLDVCAKLDMAQLTYEKLKAEQKVWQQEGEVSRLTSETLIEAAGAYIDLLAARESEAIGRRLEAMERDVLTYAEKTAKNEKSFQWLVETVRTAVRGREHAIIAAKQQGDAAAARLGYLLGMAPDVLLVPAETTLLPVKMIDAGLPTEALVAQAMAVGPGVRELEEVLAVIQRGIDAASGCGRFMPVVELHMGESLFGAGPGSSLTFGNRWDMCLGFRWNLSQLCTAQEKMNKTHAQQAQAEFSYKDLKGKLALGVQESQQVILSAQAQLGVSAEQLKNAKESHRVTNLRLKEQVMGSSPLEVLNSIRGVESAEYNTLNALRAHNRAQVRLLFLTGVGKPKDIHAAPPVHDKK